MRVVSRNMNALRKSETAEKADLKNDEAETVRWGPQSQSEHSRVDEGSLECADR